MARSKIKEDQVLDEDFISPPEMVVYVDSVSGTLQNNIDTLEEAATLNADTVVSGNVWVLDEDDMSSDSADKVPTQQSVKAYVSSTVATTSGSLVPRNEWLQNGFLDDSDVSISWNDSNRRLTISPSVTSYSYLIAGEIYTETGTLTEDILDEDGLWVIYFDSEGSLTSVKNPSHDQIDTVIENYCIIVYVQWSSTDSDGRLMYELHGTNMAPSTHHYLHDAFGAVYISGMSLADFTIDDTGDDDEDAQFSIAVGEFYDEDIAIDLDEVVSTSGVEIWYLDNSEWRWATNSGFSMLSFSPTGRLAWNDSGTQTEAGNNTYILTHIAATNIVEDSGDNFKYIAIQGQAVYGNIIQAREGAETEVNNLIYGTLPLEEVIIVASVIYQTRDLYNNSVSARIRTTDTGDDYIDWTQSGLSGKGTTTNDHGALAGLSDDDHPQYLRTDGTRELSGDWGLGNTYGITETPYMDFTLEASGIPGQEGRLVWNEEDGTLNLGMPGGEVNAQLGQELVLRCRNMSGATILNGSAVYMNGSVGNKPLLELALASDPDKIAVVGIATENIENNNDGYVTTRGLVRDIDTNGYPAGTVLFLSSTVSGGNTPIPPTAPDYKIVLGSVVRTHESAGVMGVRIILIPRLLLLSDVLAAAPNDTDFLRWNSSTSRFELNGDSSIYHTSLSGLDNNDHPQYLLTDDFTVYSGTLQTQIDAKSDIGHGHTSGDVSDFDEAAQDAVGNIMTGEGSVTVIYEDGADTITISGSSSGGSSDHSNLSNLDYANAGHTGFSSTALVTTTSGDLQTQIDGLTAFGLAGTNTEALSGNKTLYANTDVINQRLDTQNTNRVVTLSLTGAVSGNIFKIRNTSTYNDTSILEIKSDTVQLQYLYSAGHAEYVFDGSVWKGVDAFSGGTLVSEITNTSLGHKAVSHSQGTAIGNGASGYIVGVAVGSGADGYDHGAAVGQHADGHTYGVGIGYYAYAATYGVAIGANAYVNPNLYGIALGYNAESTRRNELNININADSGNNYMRGSVGWAYTGTGNTFSEIFLGLASNQRLTLSNNSVMVFDIDIAARDNTSGDVAGYSIKGVISRDASAATTVLNNSIITIIHEDDTSWDIQVSADTTNGSLKLEVKGDASNAVQWAAQGNIVETIF